MFQIAQIPDLGAISALGAVLVYWGKECSEPRTDFEKTSEILEIAKTVGFDGFCHDDASLEDLYVYLDSGLPVIIDWPSPERFSVIVGADDKNMYVADSCEKQYKCVSVKNFKKVFDLNRLVVVTPGKIF